MNKAGKSFILLRQLFSRRVVYIFTNKYIIAKVHYKKSVELGQCKSAHKTKWFAHFTLCSVIGNKYDREYRATMAEENLIGC